MTSENSTDKPSFNVSYIHILLIILVGVLCYSNTFHVPMILDDEGSIQLHTPVHGLANYFAEGWPGYTFLPNRAFGYLTFAINFELGGLNLPGYHLVNIAIHICTGLLVYSFIRLTFRTPYMQHARIQPGFANVFAFVVALFFICHPIQTQAVTYIVQRLTSMTAMFYLAALVCYLRWRMPSGDGRSDTPAKMISWYILALAATLLAMKTKEISITLPVMILLFEYSFFGIPGRKLILKISPLLITIFLIPITRILHVAPALKAAGSDGSYLSDSHLTAYNIIRMTRWDYLYTQFSVIVTYLRLLFFPVNQHLDYDYPISRTLFAPRPLLSLLLLLSILLLALCMFIKSSPKPETTVSDEQRILITSTPLLRLAAFGIFWFFITLSVESSIIVIQDVIYEHRLYLPSVGFLLSVAALITTGLTHLERRMPGVKNPALALVGCIAVALSVATYTRNNVWRDWITLWTDNVAKAPAKPRPHNILGIGYFYRGNLDRAMLQYQEALRLKPDYIEVFYNIGLVHKAKKEHKESIVMFLKALGMTAFNEIQFAKMYNEIGINYGELENPDQALKAFASAVKYSPDSVEFRNNYAYALLMQGELDTAFKEYQEVLKMDPGNSYALQAIREIAIQINQ